MNTTQPKPDNQMNALLIGAAVIVWFLISIFVGLNGPNWFFPETASAEAEAVDNLFRFMLGIGTFIFLLVQTTLWYFVVRYGLLRRRDDDTDGPPVHGNTTIEIVWTLIPSIIVFVITIYSFQVLLDTTEAREDELEIAVQGQQFFWSFTYPDEEFALSENHVLVVPRNEVIRLRMDSPDVIHAFWVPEFRVKQDVMPGRTTELRFTPTEATGLPNNESPESLIADVEALEEDIAELERVIGELEAAEAAGESTEASCQVFEEQNAPAETAEVAAAGEADALNADAEAGDVTAVGGDQPPVMIDNGYDIVCAELCGANHGLMRGEIFVVEPEEYEAYLARLRLQSVQQQLTQQVALTCGGAAIAEAGRNIFMTYGCNTCHQLNDAGSLNMGQGPSLNGIGARAATRADYEDAADYIRSSILAPNAYIAEGYQAGLMPQNYGSRIPPDELEILVQYLVGITE
ncbi:MAG: c-type cytochrome [Anaerolineae bacterium]|nr:c-type cytochrome [Anaerolineae bacterium]